MHSCAFTLANYPSLYYLDDRIVYMLKYPYRTRLKQDTEPKMAPGGSSIGVYGWLILLMSQWRLTWLLLPPVYKFTWMGEC